jgi:hypothetical protein
MTCEELEYIALVCAYEDSNPCEIPSDVRRFLPDSPDIVELSRSAVLTLLQHGLVTLAQGAEYFVEADAEAILADDSVWQGPTKMPDFVLHATETGIKALRRYPGLEKARQSELIEELFSGPYGPALYPYGLSEEKIAYWATHEVHPVMPKHNKSVILRLSARLREILKTLRSRH